MIKIDLSGKTALITGATKGIGLAVARTFYSAGANLLLTGTSESGREAILKKFNSKSVSRTISYIPVDFSEDEEVKSFLQELKKIGNIDICVNNAGTNHIKFIEDIAIGDIKRLHSINLYAPFRIMSNVIGPMKKRHWGRIVNIGSLWSILSRKGRSLYSSSKYGLMGLTVTAALECAPDNVLVNMVSPGFVWTDLSEATLTDRDREDIERRIPLGRFAATNDIANTVLFLCSDLNTYITGQNIVVDGGYICE